MIQSVPFVISYVLTIGSTTCRSFSVPLPTTPSRPSSTVLWDAVDAHTRHLNDAGDRDQDRSPSVRGAGQSRRAALATLLPSAGLMGAARRAAAADDDFGTMKDLTRQIRTSVVRGAQLIDKADGAWVRQCSMARALAAFA